ncbi:Transcriptional regulator [Hahella chejuensis KCTC 2396]|uniref:Transcriptional regulator n=1 Tax=Hahella chejuensis (strain KCTC 2396) TaxID=349521 RepID=Q2SLC6_HAHCH|nr:LysR family transcriptional regulator [Hahella chejuensis]ABC28548.1 Transcriptional regulator [Hahella chejuensis KCTC 2396]
MPSSINFKHLYYFWVIAREGSLVAASRELNLAPQTLSGQLASLESQLGGLLFKRQGKQLVLTHLGHTALKYADEMFRVAEELKHVTSMITTQQAIKVSVGISASIHKLFAYRMLEPAMKLERQVDFSCQTGQVEYLVQELDHHRFDIVLADRLPTIQRSSSIHWYKLEESTISLFAAPSLARDLRSRFPKSLHGQPFLAATLESPYFHQLMQWLNNQGIKPIVRAEIDDSALIKVFGAHGLGVFAAPTIVADEVCRQYQVESIGNIDVVMENLFAITRSRLSGNLAVEAICKRYQH